MLFRSLSTAFITTFSGKIATEGDESAWRLANKVATLTAVFMSAVTLLGIVFAPQLVDLLTWWSWPADKTALTVLLTRIMWPFMLLVSLAALVMGMLNAKHVFGPPAMASSYFNLGSIIAGVAIGWWLDPQFGARPLKRVIQKKILNELSKQILAGKVDKDSRIRLDMFDNQFVFLNPKETEHV